MRKLFCLMILACQLRFSAQPPQKFYTRFGGNGHDIGYSILQTLNGQYAVAGSTSSFGNGNTDVYLALIDSMGWIRWENSYGGFNNDIGRSIIQLSDSGFVIAGYTNSFGAGGYDVFVVRTDKYGSLIWQKTYGGFDWDFAYSVKTTSLGDSLIICGSTYSFGRGKSDGYIIKTDINGNFQWQKTYGGIEDDEFKSFVLTYNNLYAFAGTTKSMGDVKGDCWLFKTSLVGDSVLALKYGNSNIQFINDIKEHPVTKNFYLCGAYDQFGYDSTSAMLLCFDENGTFQFEDIFTYHQQKDEQFVANVYSKNNEFLYLRKSINSSTDHRLEPMVSQFNNNNYMNATKYGSIEDDELFSISKTRDKGFICAGYTKGLGAVLSDVFILKLDSNSILGATSIVGINEPKKYSENFSVYPTLTSGKINISCEKVNREINICISDCLGQLLYQGKTGENETSLNLEPYKEGIYFITLSENGLSRTFKIIKGN